MNELINEYENSNLDERIKNKRILIINTQIKKEEISKQIETLKKMFISQFKESNLDYEIEPNFNHMMIILKGEILESDLCKGIEEISIEDLEKRIDENTSDYIKDNIKLYKILDQINELYLDLRSILFNTISIIFDKNPEESNIDDLIKEELTTLVTDNILDETTYNYLSEFMKFFLDEKVIELTNE